MFPQIKLSTILICMVVAFLLFTDAGHEVVGLILLIPLMLLESIGIDGLPPYTILLMIVGCLLAYVYRRQIANWWHTRSLGKRIY
jgi:uncharacterized membrane protein